MKIVVYIGSFILLNVLFGLQLTNLVVSTLLGFLCSILFKMKWLKRRYGYRYQFIIDIPYIRKIFYISFYFGIVSIIYIYSLKIDIQMLNVICGSTEVGYYSVAWQMVQIGIVFIQSLSTSLFPNSVQKIHLRSFRMKLLKYITYLTIFVILCALLVTFLSDSIIELLYGRAYSNSVLLLNLLVWYLPMRLFAVWGSQILESGAWYKKRVLIYLTPLVINIVLNYIYLPLYGAQAAAVIALISNFILVSLITIFAFVYSKNIIPMVIVKWLKSEIKKYPCLMHFINLILSFIKYLPHISFKYVDSKYELVRYEDGKNETFLDIMINLLKMKQVNIFFITQPLIPQKRNQTLIDR